MAGAVLYGRVCYEGMAYYWQSPNANQNVAARLAELPKFVASSKLLEVSWKNSTILKGDFSEEVLKLKDQPGKNIVAFGGAGLAASLMKLGLVDEYRLMVTPTLLGAGKPLFSSGYNRSDLELVDAKIMDTGALIIHYRSNAAQIA